MEDELREGNDILAGWPQEVQDRYGHLRRLLLLLYSLSISTYSAAKSLASEEEDVENIQIDDELSEQLEVSLNMRQQWASE